jgi:VWFA-related protein
MYRRHLLFVIYAAVLSIAIVAAAPVFGQDKPSQQQPSDDVIRVNTELVQTDVTVLDKKGHFVDQLKPEQFQLVIDRKQRQIAFVDHVSSDTTTASAATATSGDASAPPGVPNTRRVGRTILFYVDDIHLAADSLMRTRKALTDFIEHGLGKKDQVAITSASGQVGFLQQFTDDKSVLQMAVARLSYQSVSKVDTDQPPMSEYMALKIRDGDEPAISYYVTEIMRQNCYRAGGGGEPICMVTPQGARIMVLNRARTITTQTAPGTRDTLIRLEGLMRTVAQFPGRKVLFVISDGFYLNDKQTGSQDRIKKITDAAGRAGVVIYTLDARGLITEALDVTNNRPTDPQGLTMGATIGEVAASQDGLNAMAEDTGGRAFRNTNRRMNEWVQQVLDETSNYYILAWRPDSDEQKKRKFDHLEVTVKDRPDLVVRLRRGYFKSAPLPVLTVSNKRDKNPEKAHEDDMRVLIDSPLPVNEIGTELSTDIYQMPGIGTRVLASIKISREALTFDAFEGKQAADVDIGGIFYDDKGKPKTSFVGRLKIYTDSSGNNTPAIYRFQSWLTPGLYQLRVGIRDVRTGRSGSATKWVRVGAAN